MVAVAVAIVTLAMAVKDVVAAMMVVGGDGVKNGDSGSCGGEVRQWKWWWSWWHG